MSPLILKLRGGLQVEIATQYTGRDIAVTISRRPAEMLAYAAAEPAELRTAMTYESWSLWVGRTAIELDNATQAEAAQRWIDQYRAELSAAEHTAVEVPA